MSTALSPEGALKLVIFDCDGVLVDSEGPSCRATAEFARANGLSITDEDAHARFAGKALPDVAAELEHALGRKLPTDTPRMLRDNLIRIMQEDAEPIDGAPAMLVDVQATGLPVRVGSNSSVVEMEAKFHRTRLTGHFPPERIHSAVDMERPKPAPDVYLHAARIEGVAPENCVVIEDSDTGSEAAFRAGMACVLLRAPDAPAPPFWPEDDAGFVRIGHLSELAPLLREARAAQDRQSGRSRAEQSRDGTPT